MQGRFESFDASNQPFFIVGSGRSGTTLLRALLDARPDVRIPGETHFYTTYRIENALRCHFLTRANYEKAVAAYPKWRHVGYETLDWARMAEIASALPARRGSLLRAYLAACAEAKGAAFAGEKTPGHIRSLDRIWKDFPGARIIHLMRDPRAVTASYLKHDLYARVYGADVMRAALKWREAAAIHARAAHGANAVNYLLLRYEDLVNDTAPALDRICDFLRLPKLPGMLELYKDHRLTLPGTQNHANIGRDLLRADERWRDVLTEEDIALVDTICGPHLDAFGYPRIAPRPLGSAALLARYLRFAGVFASYGGRRAVSAVAGKAVR